MKHLEVEGPEEGERNGGDGGWQGGTGRGGVRSRLTGGCEPKVLTCFQGAAQFS